VRRKLKFWLLLVLGMIVFAPPLILSVAFQLQIGALTLQGALLSISLLGSLVIYCILLYQSVYRRKKPRYPLVPPEGRTDIYFPRSDIPRPIHGDAKRSPDTLKKRMKKYKRKQRTASSQRGET
jgi:hypothetical protein